jgi:cell division protein FtsL
MSDFVEWVTHGVKRGRLEMDSRSTVVFSVVAATLTVVMALYLIVISRTAACGRHIEELQADIFRLQRENQQLMVKIAEESGVSRVRERAQALGFVPAEEIEFVVDSD